MSNEPTQQQDLIIYSTEDGRTRVEVHMSGDSVWLSQAQMADLFHTTKQNISGHIRNILNEGELDNSVVKDFLTTAVDGKTYKVIYYNLDMIIAVGYRVKSYTGTQFRRWATQRLKEYIVKGFTMDDERLKGIGGGNYWKELLDRIRDIRSSEKVLYRQVLDLYATSIDYDPKSPESISFFKTVQNKLHYAMNQQTAAETIYLRADSEKDFMGLTNFSGKIPVKSETKIAKNYLNKEELFRLNRMVSAFFDLAELKAEEHTKMSMKDWVEELDRFTKMYGKGTLEGSGKISHNTAMKKAEEEYKKFQVKTLSPVEKDYLDTIKTIEKKVPKKRQQKNEQD